MNKNFAIIKVNSTPYEMMVIDKVSEEYEISVFDLIMFVPYFNELFLKRATIEDLKTALSSFSQGTIDVLTGIYGSLEMYEYCDVLK